ncbi:SLOG family protein [Rhabdothermincola sp.]|uniref:SLOG family protein n=1 Tax=Rhabdothermincola sp. TaxID=2820405 RepID=UPI002FE11CB2
MSTVVYTDGACSGNPGPGGWAWAVPAGPYASGAEPRTTNQRMEITAALEAVRANPGRLEVVSDSTYVVNCFRDRWWEGWLERGWKNSQRKPVANRDLWEPLVELVRARGDVTFRWVKGHGGDPMNELVDRLAVEAALEQRGRSGIGAPPELGPADRVGRPQPAALADAPLPGHPLVVFGHRPPELGGYGDNPVAAEVRRKLVQILRAKHELFADLVVVTGLRLGAEMLGAQAAREAGVPYLVVLPYPHPEKVWPDESQHQFRDLLDDAIDVITLERKEPRSKQQAGAALARRDAWLARHAAEAVLVWDRRDESLGRLHRSLTDHLGEDVWILEPPAPDPEP